MKQPHTRVRARRDRADLRRRLLEAALHEFAAHGFVGASTRAIAHSVGAHQPQINYHFASKDALWRAAIDHLFANMNEALGIAALGNVAKLETTQLAAEFATMLRRLVTFVAANPELNRIMVHEATSPGERLDWLTEQHVRPYFDGMRPLWRRLVKAGIAAPIDDRLIHHVLLGASSLVFVNAHEFSSLVGESPTTRKWIDRHADGLIAMLLPGL